MIQPLRTVHRRVFTMLALLLPAVLVVGLGARHRAMPLVKPVEQASSSRQLVRTSGGKWRTHVIEAEVYADPSETGKLYVLLKPTPELSDPDLLLYWSATGPSGNSLPAEARLLGAYGPNQALVLPADAAQGGYLTLYSLAHQSVVDTAAMEKLP